MRRGPGRWVVVAAALPLACGRGEAPAPPDCPLLPAVTVAPEGTPEVGPDTIAAGASSRGSRSFVLLADTAFRRAGEPVVRLCGVRLVLLDSAGREVARLVSGRGELDPATEAMVVRDGVVVDVVDGARRLATPELHYSPREDRVWSPAPTTFERPGLDMRADSFVSDARFERVRAFRARGTVRWDPS